MKTGALNVNSSCSLVQLTKLADADGGEGSKIPLWMPGAKQTADTKSRAATK